MFKLVHLCYCCQLREPHVGSHILVVINCIRQSVNRVLVCRKTLACTTQQHSWDIPTVAAFIHFYKIVLLLYANYTNSSVLEQCFSTAGPRPGTGPRHQLYRSARGSPGICHFSFLSIFHEQIIYSGNILRRITFLMCRKAQTQNS